MFPLNSMTDRSIVVVHESVTNSLLVRSDAERLESISEVVTRLDQPTRQNPPGGDSERKRSPLNPYDLESMSEFSESPAFDPGIGNRREPATSRTRPAADKDFGADLNKQDQRARQLAREYRELLENRTADHPDAQKLRDELTEAVTAAFEARQQLQQEELTRLRQRLLRIQELIAARQRINQQIIDRRIEELIESK